MLHKIPVLYTVGNVDFVQTIDGNSPMACYFKLGRKVVAINEYKKYTTAEREALDCHEEAHIINGNADEHEADRLGFIIFIARGNKDLNAWVTAYTKLFAGKPNNVAVNSPAFLMARQEQKQRLENIKKMVQIAENDSTAYALNSGFALDPISGILQGIGSASSGIDSLVNGNKRALLSHQSHVAALQGIQAQSQASMQNAQLSLQNSKVMAALKNNQTELMVVAAVVVVLAVLFYMAWKSGRAPKMQFTNLQPQLN